MHPCMELCKQLASRNYHATLIFPSTSASRIPSSFTKHPRTKNDPDHHFRHTDAGSDALSQQAAQDLEANLVTALEIQTYQHLYVPS